MSKHIIYINGTAIEVSEEIYTYIRRSDWNNQYAAKSSANAKKSRLTAKHRP